MPSNRARFLLVGPHQGKTLSVCDREFVDGAFEFEGNPTEVANLTNLFSYYGAVPEEVALALALDAPPPSKDEEVVVDPVVPQTQDEAKTLTLAEAIGALDPDNEDHWTSNNLPSLDVLSEMTGARVSRAQVDEHADGFTRAKAKALKA